MEGIEVPLTPRPKVAGHPTPTPPSPRPVISGQRTPVPPKARPRSGPSRAPELFAEVFAEPASSSDAFVVVPVSDVAAEDDTEVVVVDPPREPCKLHNASVGLSEVLLWLTQAIGLGYRYILSLDQHHVADRSVSQTRELLQVATRERTLVCVLSFIPKNSYEAHGNKALALWRDAVSSCADYPLRPLPLIVTSQPLGPWGKAATLRWLRERLWSDHDQASWTLWTHVDDRADICKEFSGGRGIKAVHWHVRDRRSLLTLCREEGVL